MQQQTFKYANKEIRRVGFVGFGKSNAGVFRYLKKHYPHLNYTIRAKEKQLDVPERADRLFFGSNCFDSINEDIIFFSPSAKRDDPMLLAARERGVILSSDCEFFFKSSEKDIFAVTGSDGKSTTTYLTSRLLTPQYKSVYPIGNYGECMTEHLDDEDGCAYVTELSSFQLSFVSPRSKRCVITNITENHIDWHGTFEEYKSAKRKVLEFSGERIYNYDSLEVRDLIKDYPAFAVYSLRESEAELRKRVSAALYLTFDGNSLLISGKEFLKIRDIKAKGIHNIYNFCAAILMSYGFSSDKDVKELAKSFTGLPHRFETVGTFDGVTYIDSSIDSSPSRTAATLSCCTNRVILILGGRSKGLSYEALIPALNKKVYSIIFVGECGKEIEDVFLNSKDFMNMGIGTHRFEGLFDGVKFAKSIAAFGDVVLLSPAATSYDEFKNFEERGDAFANYIKQLN